MNKFSFIFAIITVIIASITIIMIFKFVDKEIVIQPKVTVIPTEPTLVPSFIPTATPFVIPTIFVPLTMEPTSTAIPEPTSTPVKRQIVPSTKRIISTPVPLPDRLTVGIDSLIACAGESREYWFEHGPPPLTDELATCLIKQLENN